MHALTQYILIVYFIYMLVTTVRMVFALFTMAVIRRLKVCINFVNGIFKQIYITLLRVSELG